MCSSDLCPFLRRTRGRIDGDRGPHFEVAVHDIGKQLVGDDPQVVGDVVGHIQFLNLLNYPVRLNCLVLLWPIRFDRQKELVEV